jgi:hypothetical protein
MFDPTRDQVRSFFFDTWRKYRSGTPLAGLETVGLGVILLHPEYHRVLDDPEKNLAQEYFPEGGETNPFLHLSLHLALEEQLSIDQPPGIARHFATLAARLGERLAARPHRAGQRRLPRMPGAPRARLTPRRRQ